MRTHHLALGLVAALALSACGTAAGESPAVPADGAGAAAGACLEGSTDCVDTPGLDDAGEPDLDEAAVESLRRDARTHLGWAEAELSELVRVGRRGDEQHALTEDYVLGRITVELDEVDGVHVVTAATVELPDGPETFTLER
jgi:hypothetical protein